MSELEQKTGGLQYSSEYFAALYDVEAFAERAALGEAPYVPDIQPNELIELVQLILDGDEGDSVTEYYVDLFERNVSHGSGASLIYHSHKYWPSGHEPTATEIVEKAISPSNVIRL